MVPVKLVANLGVSSADLTSICFYTANMKTTDKERLKWLLSHQVIIKKAMQINMQNQMSV